MRPRQEKRKRQAEVETKRRQLEDDRRQLQHLKVLSGQPQGPPELAWRGRGRQRPRTRASAWYRGWVAGRHPDSDPDPCHPQSKALRERWLLEGTPSSASEGDEDLRRQMQEDEQKARLLEESICRWVGQAVPAPAESGSQGRGPTLGLGRGWEGTLL